MMFGATRRLLVMAPCQPTARSSASAGRGGFVSFRSNRASVFSEQRSQGPRRNGGMSRRPQRSLRFLMLAGSRGIQPAGTPPDASASSSIQVSRCESKFVGCDQLAGSRRPLLTATPASAGTPERGQCPAKTVSPSLVCRRSPPCRSSSPRFSRPACHTLRRDTSWKCESHLLEAAQVQHPNARFRLPGVDEQTDHLAERDGHGGLKAR